MMFVVMTSFVVMTLVIQITVRSDDFSHPFVVMTLVIQIHKGK
jgi:hypothetical protein